MTALKNRFRLLLLLMVLPATAQATTSVGLSTIMTTFQSVTQGWYHAIFTDALGLFAALFGIEVTWLAVTWMIGGKDVHDIFSSFVKKLLSIGFFYTVLESSGQWVPWIIGGFKNVAVTAGGEPITTVSFIAMTGLRAFILCIEGGPVSTIHSAGTALSDLWNLNLSGAATAMGNAADSAVTTALGVNTLVGILVGFILLLSFIYVVLELVAVQLEGMIVLSAGVIMLGFGGSSFTSRFVEAYMQYSVSVGVRLMVITLWASFIEWQVNPLIKSTLINGNAGLEAYGVVLILALLIAWLTKKLPGFANSILSGQSTLSGGELYDAVKKGSIAAAAVVTGGAVLAAGVAGTASAGAMSAAEGAAGSAGAGSLGASQAAGEAGSSEAGTLQAPALPQGPEAGSGVQAPSSGQPSAPSGGQAPASGQTPASDPVDHRPAAPNESPSGGSSDRGVQAPSGQAPSGTSAPSGSQAPDTGSGKGLHPARGGDGSGTSAPEQKTPFDLAKDAFTQTQSALHGAHDTLTPGSPSSTGVQAPSLGIKHLSD